MTLTISEGVEVIEGYAFYGARSLLSVSLPTTLTRMDDGAFGQCEALTTITIGNRVTHIGHYAFFECSNLTIHVHFPVIPDTWVSGWNPQNC